MSCRNEFSTASSQCWRLLIVGIVTSVVIHAVVFHASPCMAADAPAKKSVHPLVRALKYARSSLKTVEAASDYSAEFVKRDIVNGQVHAHTTLLKYRAKPMSAYLKFKVPHAGREVIYVQGKNDGKLLAHETGLASLIGTISLLPTRDRKSVV